MRKPAAILWILLSLSPAGCGGGGGSGEAPALPPPPAIYTVGGTVTGIKGTDLVLQNNGGDDLAVPVSGSFTFKTKVAAGAAYDITVLRQPAGALAPCVVTNGSGMVANGNVSDVAVVCALAGLWSGQSCCVKFDPFSVIGITTDTGDDRFMLLGAHYVGKLGAAQTAYATCGNCLAGPVISDAHEFSLKFVVPGISAQGSVASGLPPPFNGKWGFSVPYDPSSGRAASLATIKGIYTTNTGAGYTLTIVIDADGHATGNDTNACNLDGQISVGQPDVDVYSVALDVNSCGATDGHYAGNAALLFDNGGKPTELFLSVSNPTAAVGWMLSR